MLRVLRNARIPMFLHRKSTHIFAVWQLVVLFVLRQYEGKSYRLFVEDWLVEAFYLRMFFQLSRIPHYTTLQKFAARIDGSILAKIISSFILLLNYIHWLFIGIDSSGFKITNASQYYIDKAKLRNKYLKIKNRTIY